MMIKDCNLTQPKISFWLVLYLVKIVKNIKTLDYEC